MFRHLPITFAALPPVFLVEARPARHTDGIVGVPLDDVLRYPWYSTAVALKVAFRHVSLFAHWRIMVCVEFAFRWQQGVAK